MRVVATGPPSTTTRNSKFSPPRDEPNKSSPTTRHKQGRLVNLTNHPRPNLSPSPNKQYNRPSSLCYAKTISLMASEQDDTVFPEEDLDDDDELSEEEDDDDDDEIETDDVVVSASPSSSSPAAHAVTVALQASSVPNGEPPIAATTTIVTSSSTPSPKQLRSEGEEKKPQLQLQPLPLPQPQPQPQPIDDSRRLFQRLWTDEDEIELLQGFLDYTTSRGSTHHNDTALFYDQIKSKLQLDFNKNQLVEKLRRLKKKYRNVVGKISTGKDFSFKSPHDQATFEISRKIWSNSDFISGRLAVDDSVFDDEDTNLKNPNFMDDIGEKKPNSTPKSRKRPRSATRGEEKRNSSQTDNKTNGDDNSKTSHLGGVIEETVRSCLSPLLRELLSNAMGIGGRGIGMGFGLGGLGMNALPLSLGGGEGTAADERWRKQHILELEVYAKRLELVQDQIRVALEELRSMGR